MAEKTKKEQATEEFKVKGNEAVEKVKQLIEEGNARRIIVKNEKGKVIMEIPLTFGVIGVFAAPYLAALGALVAIITSCSIVVEKR